MSEDTYECECDDDKRTMVDTIEGPALYCDCCLEMARDAGIVIESDEQTR